MRSGVDVENVASNVKRFLSVFIRITRFLSVLSVLDLTTKAQRARRSGERKPSGTEQGSARKE